MTNVNYHDPHLCQAACTADGDKCKAYTYVVRPPLHASCCLKSTVDKQDASSTCTSGIKGTPTPGQLRVRLGSCSAAQGAGLRSSSSSRQGSVALRADGSVSVRVLPDRSLADFFVNGGAWAGTQAWGGSVARAPAASSVLLWATNGTGITADIEAWSMGCGWVDPSYTEHPTL